MEEVRIQVAFHCTIDPAAQIIGDINYPVQVQRTIVVGDEIEVSKVNFESIFNSEIFNSVDEMANKVVAEHLRTAKPITTPKAASVQNVTENTSGGECANPSGVDGDGVEDDGESVF